MYAIVKTESEANQLNDYIKAEYFNQVTGASFDKWTDIIQIENGFALEVMEEWVDYPVPEFIVNGIEFATHISVSESINKTLETEKTE